VALVLGGASERIVMTEDARVVIVGLGYVGLPLAVAFVDGDAGDRPAA
jgi:UDP-N-acetyl-D-mannosaminuronate dehydrogenase